MNEVAQRGATVEELLAEAQAVILRLRERIARRKQDIVDEEGEAVAGVLGDESDRGTTKASSRLATLREEVGLLEQALRQAKADRDRLEAVRRDEEAAADLVALKDGVRRSVETWRRCAKAIDQLVEGFVEMQKIHGHVEVLLHGPLQERLGIRETDTYVDSSQLFLQAMTPASVERLVRLGLTRLSVDGWRSEDPLPGMERKLRDLESIDAQSVRTSR